MITKNLTFVVTNIHVENFVVSLNKINTNYGDWAEDVKAFTISEKADPEVTNLALQLTFSSRQRLEVFEQLVLHKIFEDLQKELPEQLLYFETHLEKLF